VSTGSGLHFELAGNDFPPIVYTNSGNRNHCFGGRKMKQTRVCRWWLSLIIVGFAALTGCSSGTPGTTQDLTGIEEDLAPVLSDPSIIAEGRTVPLQEASLSFISGGVVREVLVREGEMVQAGQVLARLAGDEQIESVIAAAELEVLVAEQEIALLYENLPIERAQAQLSLAEARKELDKAQKRLQSKDYQRGDADMVDIARANYILAEDNVSDATEIFDIFDDRGESDPERAAAFSQLATARQQRDTALANLNYLLSRPNPFEVEKIDADLVVAEARAADAERMVNKLEAGPDASKLALAEARLANAKLSLEAALASRLDLELRAPFNGVIDSLEITGGEFAAPGSVVARLSDQSSWIVETTDLTELNIARIKPGMPATIRFDAISDLEVIARVMDIGTYGENRQGDIVYQVRLKIDQPDSRVRWNMTTTVKFIEKLD
jgi:multidrug resistance efflux pump